MGESGNISEPDAITQFPNLAALNTLSRGIWLLRAICRAAGTDKNRWIETVGEKVANAAAPARTVTCRKPNTV